jgi:hypothetical protein
MLHGISTIVFWLLWLLWLLLLRLVIYPIAIYNTLATLKNRYLNAFAQIEVRHTLFSLSLSLSFFSSPLSD